MKNTTENNTHEIARLAAINEELLRSKGKLMQEIISLKKQLEAEAGNKKLIENLQLQISTLNAEIAAHLLHTSALCGQIDVLKQNLSLMELQRENAYAEIERLRKRKWYHRLFNKK